MKGDFEVSFGRFFFLFDCFFDLVFFLVFFFGVFFCELRVGFLISFVR